MKGTNLVNTIATCRDCTVISLLGASLLDSRRCASSGTCAHVRATGNAIRQNSHQEVEGTRHGVRTEVKHGEG